MIVIRLARAGRHKRPFYHVVVTDKRSPRDGRFIERLGYYNPIAQGNDIFFNVDMERIDHWVSVGAQMTERTEYLIKHFRKNGSTTKPEKRKKPGNNAQTEATATA